MKIHYITSYYIHLHIAEEKIAMNTLLVVVKTLPFPSFFGIGIIFCRFRNLQPRITVESFQNGEGAEVSCAFVGSGSGMSTALGERTEGQMGR